MRHDGQRRWGLHSAQKKGYGTYFFEQSREEFSRIRKTEITRSSFYLFGRPEPSLGGKTKRDGSTAGQHYFIELYVTSIRHPTIHYVAKIRCLLSRVFPFLRAAITTQISLLSFELVAGLPLKNA